MTDLDLTGQQVEADKVASRLLILKNMLDLRAPIWDKLSREKKVAWVKSPNDPIMGITWDITKYFARKFPEMLHEALEHEGG